MTELVEWSRPVARRDNRVRFRVSPSRPGRPRCLDLFCGGGGTAMGWHMAGFDVVGVDIHPRHSFPFEFVQADAMSYPLDGFDLIHASPPCQAYTVARGHDEHAKLIEPLRDRLVSSGLPYVIENVPGAPLIRPVILCGSMFGLPIRRHRLFESNIPLRAPGDCSCRNAPRCYTIYGHAVWCRSGDQPREKVGFDEGEQAMGIGWMTQQELCQAIPPVYTWWLGRQVTHA